MIERHFIVSQRENAWLYSFRGDSAGPFKTREEAIAAAIGEASELADIKAEVIVQDHDMQQETVWRHPDNSGPDKRGGSSA